MLMGRLCMTVMVTFLMCAAAYAQEEDLMRVMGVDSPEEADPDEVERMADLLVHPLRINMVSESRLMAAGLLTRYQVASLTDYRRKHGNVVSFTELAAVDGFGEETVERLRRFISLECYALQDSKLQVQNDLAAKTASKFVGQNEGYDWNYGVKYRLRSDRFSMALAGSRS